MSEVKDETKLEFTIYNGYECARVFDSPDPLDDDKEFTFMYLTNSQNKKNKYLVMSEDVNIKERVDKGEEDYYLKTVWDTNLGICSENVLVKGDKNPSLFEIDLKQEIETVEDPQYKVEKVGNQTQYKIYDTVYYVKNDNDNCYISCKTQDKGTKYEELPLAMFTEEKEDVQKRMNLIKQNGKMYIVRDGKKMVSKVLYEVVPESNGRISYQINGKEKFYIDGKGQLEYNFPIRYLHNEKSIKSAYEQIDRMISRYYLNHGTKNEQEKLKKIRDKEREEKSILLSTTMCNLTQAQNIIKNPKYDEIIECKYEHENNTDCWSHKIVVQEMTKMKKYLDFYNNNHELSEYIKDVPMDIVQDYDYDYIHSLKSNNKVFEKYIKLLKEQCKDQGLQNYKIEHEISRNDAKYLLELKCLNNKEYEKIMKIIKSNIMVLTYLIDGEKLYN